MTPVLPAARPSFQAIRPHLRASWPLLRTLAGVAILAVLGWRLGTDAFMAGLRVIDGTAILAALGIGLLTTVFSAGRWCIVARGLGLRLRMPAAVADYYQAQLLNAVLPAGVLGDVNRAVSHGRESGDVGRGVRAVVLERVAGQIVLVAAGVAALLTQPVLVSAIGHALVPSGTGLGSSAPGLLGFPGELLLPIMVVVPCGLAVALTPAIRGRRARRARPVPASKWRRALATAVTDARQGLFARRTWPGVMLLSAAALLGHIVLFLVAARVAGSAAPVTGLVPLALVALLVMGLPLNVGGWGPREAVTALAFGAAGLEASQGLTVAVVYGVLALVASLPGVAVLVARRIDRPGSVRTRPEKLVAPARLGPAPLRPEGVRL